MRIGGTDLISPQTQHASLRLITLSFATVFIWLFEIELAELVILGVNLSGVFFFNLMFFVILFQLTGLIFHWLSDYVSYTRWFEKNIAELEIWPDPISLRRTQQEAISHLISRIGENWHTFELEANSGLSPKIAETFAILDQLKLLLEKCGRNASSISILGKLQIYIWYGLIPCCFGILGAAISAAESFYF